MASSINASTSGAGGVITTADNTGNLELQSGGSTIATVSSTGLSLATGKTLSVGGAVGSPFSMKNRIINGDMRIDQRNNGASVATTVTGNSTYTLDRWAYYCDQASKFTVQKTPSTTETGFSGRLNAGFTDYLACTSTSNYSVISTDTLGVFQIIEAANIADLAWGTANAKTITLSFWAYSSITGTHAGSIRNANGYNLSYVFTYSIPVANTWTKINLTIAGPTTGTWLTSGQGATIYFNVGAGSNSQTTAGIWTVGNKTSTSGAVNIVGTNGATFYVTGVQLEVGSSATSFEWRPYTTEFQLCQRYYQVIGGVNGQFPLLGGYSASTGTNHRFPISFPVQMRAAATATRFGTWDLLNCNAISIEMVGPMGYTLMTSSTLNGVNWYAYPNSTDDIITFSAEL